MKTKNSFLKIFFVPLGLAAACVVTIGSAKADLFESVTVAEADSVAKVDSDILKRRVVRVNFAEFAQQTRVGAKLPLNLFADVAVKGTVTKVEDRGAKNYTLSGNLDGDDNSTFTVAVYGDAVAMNVREKENFYQIRFVKDGLHEIFQMADHKFGGCEVKPEHHVAAPGVAADAAGQPPAEEDAGDVVDVMVVYTPSVRTAAGSSNAIHAAINLGVTESNTAFTQSQVGMQIRLVYAGEIAYVESGFNAALTAVTSTSDGIMDQVHTLRNTYGADLVSLWINDNSACGLAWVMTTLSSGFAANGFSVCHWAPGCATGYYSFAHEMAHNMGCTHDRAAAGGQALYSYSYGWHFTGTNGVQYRSVMAYSPGSRVARFSNPNVNYLGTPTGVATGQVNEAHNALTLNNSKLTVANFRSAVVSTNTPPSISEQPQPQSVAIGGTANFSVTASGTPTLYYFWRRAGTNIPGATLSSYTINNVQLSDANNYSVRITNAFGSITSSVVALDISSFADAVDNSGFTWTQFGNSPWIDQSVITHDGVDAAESGVIPNSGFSNFETPIVGPGTLSFWWKVSSEEGWDYLDVVFNGTALLQYGISGEVSWTPMSFEIPEGTHTWGWQYSKDSSFFEGADKAWVDQISYVGGSSFANNSLGKTNGQYKFVWNGLAGATYTIQASTNLTSWATLTNLIISSPTNLFIDSGSAGLSNRFYRIHSP